MSAAVALGIIALVVVATIALGLYGVRGVKMDAQEYIVGGRRIGALLLWLLLAGEIYTTFTFLGAAGWAYGKGAPAYYILCYGTLAYIISFFLAPAVHRIARERGYLTGPDFFRDRYESRLLGALVALVGFVMLVPYVTLQLTGIQILVQIAGFGRIDPLVAVAIAFFMIALFTFVAGLRGAAWAAVAKDGLVLIGVIFAGLVLPAHFFGSPAGAMDAVLRDPTHPNWLVIGPPSAGANSITWVVTTVVLTGCGFFMWPQSMAAIYSARDEETLRRNAIFLPFYQVMLLLVFFAGFTALEVVPGLKGPAADQSFMLIVQKYYPAWVLGIIAAAGVLAGLVPAAGQMLAAASIIGKNVCADYGFARDERSQTLVTRVLVLVVAILAFGFWAVAKTTLVGLLLIGYNGVTQFFPGVVLGVADRRPSAAAVGAGIVAGLVVLIVCTVRGVGQIDGVNTGLIALIANVVVLAIASVAVPRRATSGEIA
ncbi:MAG TPA: sodium:solute symporter family protein [Candidatus Baltobacteraceae bacterium]|nr:sodium:solute symporter family protein [Candidatus Baltobacteraceae bacterium]